MEKKISHLDYLNQAYPVRKTEQEKAEFRNYIVEMLAKKGIDARVERSSNGKNNNLIVGDPTTAKAVFTAHYDTPACSIFPNIMIPKNRVVFYAYQFVPIIFLLIVSFALAHLFGNIVLQDERAYYMTFLISYYGLFFGIMRGFKNKHNYNDNTSGVATVLGIIDELSDYERSKTAFILFDNEEKGKKGSAAYFKDHKEEMKNRFLLNFDCVGNGDNIIYIAEKGAIDSEEYEILKNSFEKSDKYSLDFCTCKKAQSNSDHKNFPMGVACIACKKTKQGLLYTPAIHTHRDVVAYNDNIDYITKNTTQFVRKILP